MRLRPVALVILASMWSTGCTDRSPAATSEPSAATADSIGERDTEVVPPLGETDTPVASADSTTVRGAASTTVATAATSAAESVVPPPPVTGCRGASAAASVVEIAFDDDTLRYDAAVAPPCVRVHVTQRLQVTNAAHFDSVVSVGATSQVLAMGTSLTTALVGSFHGVGDVFDVSVDVLSASVLIQVVR